MKKLKTLDSIYFRGKSRFEEDGTQNYLVFQPMHRQFKRVVNYHYISEWKSKELFDESIKSYSALHIFFNPSLNYLGAKIRVGVSGSCLKQDKITYTILTSINILDMELDLIDKDFFLILMVELVEM